MEAENAHQHNGTPNSPPKSRLDTSASAHPQASHKDDNENTITLPASVVSPPYWMQSHHRSFSNISAESVAPGGITLLDNTEDGGDDSKNDACWAKNVYIEDFTIINESRTNIGAFVVWTITVETLEGGTMRIRKRYSEFDELREKLLKTFPNSEASMPQLPPKSIISKFRPKFLETRRAGIQYFFNCILLNPEFSSSPVLKEFLFS